jgi:hypothetical protein
MSDSSRAVNSLDQLRETVDKLPDRLAQVLAAGREQASARTGEGAPDRAGGLEKIAQGLRGTPVLDQLAVGMARGRAIQEGIGELTGRGRSSKGRAVATERAAAKAAKDMERSARAALKKAEQEQKRRAREQAAAEKKARAWLAKVNKENSARIQRSRKRFKALAAKKAKAARGTGQRQQNLKAASRRRAANRARGRNLNQQVGKAKRQTQLGPAGLNRSQQAELRRQGVPDMFVEQHAKKRETQLMPEQDRAEAGDSKEATEAMKKLAEEVKKLTEEMSKQRQKSGGGQAPVPGGSAPAEQAAQPGAGPRVSIRRRERPAPQRPEQPNPRGGALTAVRQTQLRSG